MKYKLHLLFALFFILSANVVVAQDDELPPPTSKPRPETVEPDKNAAPVTDDNDFTGFTKKKKKKVEWSKFIIEPNFNLAIAQGRTDVGLSPYVGYNVWKGLYAGGGITYFYTGFPNIQVVDQFNRITKAKANFHTYGGGVFVQYNVWRGFFARAKLEVLQRNMSDIDGPLIPQNPSNYYAGFKFNRIQRTVPSLLVGVGYNLLQSKNFFFPILISYNLLNNAVPKTYAIYPNAFVIQLGFVNVF